MAPIDLTLEQFLAAWGAVVATILAVKEILGAIRNRTDVNVAAVMTYAASVEGTDTHGILFRDMSCAPPAWKEGNVDVIVWNKGEQPCQITHVFIEDEANYILVTPPQLPTILAPKTRISLLVQPEVLGLRLPTPIDGDDPPRPAIQAMGVLDGLGKKYLVKADQLARAVTQARALPMRFIEDRQSEPGFIRYAFQMRDPGRLQSKREEFRPMPMDEGWPD